MTEKHKPGEIAKTSGQYPIVGPRGGKNWRGKNGG